VPKINRFGGPSNIGLTERDAGFAEPVLQPPADWVRPAAPPFDPGEYSVSDVVAELGELAPVERHAVIEAERAGKARAGILKWAGDADD